MSESTMRGRVVKALASLDALAVENPIRPGTPDVNLIPGWIELKQLTRWPKVPAHKPILIKHFTQQQRIWLRRRCGKGGKAWMLLQIEQEWFLFWGATAAMWVGRCSRKELQERSLIHWPKGLCEPQLLSAMGLNV